MIRQEYRGLSDKIRDRKVSVIYSNKEDWVLDQQKLFFPIKIGVSRDETDTLVYDNNNCFSKIIKIHRCYMLLLGRDPVFWAAMGLLKPILL